MADTGFTDVTFPNSWSLPAGDGTTVSSQAFHPDFIWVVSLGFVVAFILAFAIGANDVANSFGTSVGSKVLTLKQACVLAVIFETAGACTLGFQVSDTIWKQIVDIKMYEQEEKILMIGEVSALLGTAIWLLIATTLKIPVSGSHAIVGATMGFSFVRHGYHGIRWLSIIGIVASWFVSPVFAGGISGFLFILVRRFILKSTNPLQSGLRALPIFYGITIFVNTISIFLGGAIQQIPWWGGLIISCGLSIVTLVVVQLWVVPWQRQTIFSNINRLKASNATALMCAMNCSVATNLDLLDEGIRTAQNEHYLLSSGTSTTTLDELGDADRMKPIRTFSLRSESISELEELGQDLKPNNKEYIDENNNQYVAYEYTEKEAQPNRNPETFSPRRSYKRSSLVGRQMARKKPSPEFKPLKTGDEERSRNTSVRSLEENDHTPWWIICWQNLRTLGHRDVDEKAMEEVAPPQDLPEIAAIFSFLQILTATFTAFAHGANDVSNAIGPLVAIWVIFENGSIPASSSTPSWLLLFGGAGISIGLCVLGRKVIETVGSSLAVIIPSSGFCIGLGTATTVLMCSKIGLPVSTTHCIVGSVVAVGWLRSRRAVNWKVFGNIMGCALMTLPVAAACGAASMALLCLFH